MFPVIMVVGLSACDKLPPQANQTYGVFAYDASTRTLWMNGDDRYYVPESVFTGNLICASTINVTWKPDGDRRVVERYYVGERSSVFC